MSRDKYYSLWKKLPSFPGESLTIYGASCGGLKTGFWIPELKIMLDAGIPSPFEPQKILLTHSHLDHSFALPLLIIGSPEYLPEIILPQPSLEKLDKFIEATFSFGDSKIPKYLSRGVSPGEMIPIGPEESGALRDRGGLAVGSKDPGAPTHTIKTYRLFHDTPAVGYGIVTGSEHLMAYLTDTNIRVFEEPEILCYPVIMIECMKIRGKTDNHITWEELELFVSSCPKINFRIIHISKNIDLSDFREHVKGYPNVLIVE